MNYVLRYKKPALDCDYGWEHQSLPVGNGWLGANIFGIVDRDRIQITENSLQNPGEMGGLNSFAELYLHFDHKKVTGYQRGLCLNDAVAYTQYTVGGVQYRREYFVSYPDRTLVVHLTASKPFAVRLELKVPYVKPYALKEGDGGGKSGTLTYEGNRAHLRGRMEYYNIRFAGELAVVTDGSVTPGADGLGVKYATEITVYMTVGTNYELRPEVFLRDDPKKKLRDFNPGGYVAQLLEKVLAQSFDAVRQRHLDDYRTLFGRVELELGEEKTVPTDVLLRKYARGKHSPYLEMLYFQYGRYLLIASSRKGTLPANLQGVWNVHDHSPWGSGYWHNINVQMNYWPAFSTNLAETFDTYADFNAAFRPKAELLAREYIRRTGPKSFEDGNCGWTVGTGVYPYSIEGPGGHSGPGTGGLTTKLFWDAYDFTRDPEILKTVTYPALRGMSEFLTKTVRLDGDGLYRTDFSASPEQVHNQQYYHTRGCAFDQQMIWENGKDYLAASEQLGVTSDFAYRQQKAQMEQYHPVRIGGSGQIKEFEEENLYGEIGEYTHRHISQLIGLYPGTAINRNTPAWMDAARFTLTERGDRSTGWALAHRLNAWARLGDGEHAYRVFRLLLGKRTMDNLWDFHPPFQIDGNFGGTAGVAEMLLQSHDGCIAILPALPKVWKNGHVKGLMARGAFEVDISWQDCHATEIQIRSKAGGSCSLSYPGIEYGCLSGADEIKRHEDLVTFDTMAGRSYTITRIPTSPVTCKPRRFELRNGMLHWKKEVDTIYRVYRSMDDAPDYTLLAELSCGSFRDSVDVSSKQSVLYKLTAQKKGCRESIGTVIAVTNTDRKLLRRHSARTLCTKLKDLGWYFCCEMDRVGKGCIQRLHAWWESFFR